MAEGKKNLADRAVPKKKTQGANASVGKPANKGKFPKKPESHPWDKMKKGETAAKKATKPVKEMRDFLYLLPKRTSAKRLAEALGFIDKRALEIWEEECVLEITTESGIVTFEDIRESLEKEDKEVLSNLRMKQVLSCDYESTNAELVKKIMTAFLKAFGGKIGSDTEDFTPFLELEEL